LVQSKQGVQLSPLAAIQVEPIPKEQPALAPYQIPRGTSPAKELGSPPLIGGLPRMLQNVTDRSGTLHCTACAMNPTGRTIQAAGQKDGSLWRECLKLGATIDGFTGVENSFCVAFEVLVEESQRVSLRNVKIVEALVAV
jgi:hypothetical protein